ncbi:hypothetical protein R3P38DRAFT_3172174 [Favolaschia claudopus]|uniref:Uncharacterized protein n=1 Tax=Favolaschia claudopus TaxID=2862362 RepID=A0AAW0DIN0_9AGAR
MGLKSGTILLFLIEATINWFSWIPNLGDGANPEKVLDEIRHTINLAIDLIIVVPADAIRCLCSLSPRRLVVVIVHVLVR